MAELLKSEVRSLGYYLDVPPAVIARTPGADLWQGQTDEGELGLSADVVEAFLTSHGDDDFTNAGYVTYLGLKPHEVQIVRRLKQHQHKLRRAPHFEPPWQRYSAGVPASTEAAPQAPPEER